MTVPKVTGTSISKGSFYLNPYKKPMRKMLGLWIPGNFENIIEAIEHLKKHKEVYWTIGGGIKDWQELSMPLVGLIYLNKNGDIRCCCKIAKILPFFSTHYKDLCKKPKKWIKDFRMEKLKKKRYLTLVITKIKPIFYKSNKLKNVFGYSFKPGQNCIKIRLPRVVKI
jgi:hypothetical protein